MEQNAPLSGWGEEKGWGVTILFLALIIIIVWSVKRGIRKAKEESGYEAKDLWGGQNVLKIDCWKNPIPKVLPPNTVAYCVDDWEWLEMQFRSFYKSLDELEQAKKGGNQAEITKAKSKVWDAGQELTVGVSLFDGDNNMWFIKINDILLNLDKKIVKV